MRGLQLCRRRPEWGRGGRRASTSAAWATGEMCACVREIATLQLSLRGLHPPGPQLRVQRPPACPPCLCSYAARARPPPTRARPRQEKPPNPPGPRRRRWRLSNTAAPPPHERNVVSAGTACMTELRPGRRGGRGLTSCGNLAREPLPRLPVCTGQ